MAADAPYLACRLNYAAGALRLHISFTLAARRAVLWGPSGAGKSTLLRLIAGLARPGSGSVQLNGRTLVDTAQQIFVPAGRRGVGLLTQDPALFPHLSVRENIAFGLAALAPSERRARTDELLERFSLTALATRQPGSLSGGESRRVALARALAPRPTLLLLDEAFAALDSARRDETRAALERSLVDQPTAVLTVTHEVAEAFTHPTPEILVLRDGAITAQGPPHQTLGAERTALLERLAGSSPQAPLTGV